MSLIERAADILGETPSSETKMPSTTERTVDSALVERAAGSTGLRSTPASDGSFPGAHHAPGVTNPDQRTYRIDIDKLREQQAVTPDTERTPIAENFRRIKRHILGNLGSAGAPTGSNLVMITSALPGEGKTFCTVNLAISIAMEMDRTVLLVDADVARPSVASFLGMTPPPQRGLMDVLLGRNKANLADVLCRTNIGKLSVLPAGTRHSRATEILASEAMRSLLQEMASRYEDRVIIFDSPPILAASEASVLASHMGQILVVVEAGRTTETTLKDALSRMEPRNVLGVLLNKGGAPQGGYYGGYDYGYGHSV